MITVGQLVSAIRAEEQGKVVEMVTHECYNGYISSRTREYAIEVKVSALALEELLDTEDLTDEGYGTTYQRTLRVKE
jgi:hypothetical protein